MDGSRAKIGSAPKESPAPRTVMTFALVRDDDFTLDDGVHVVRRLALGGDDVAVAVGGGPPVLREETEPVVVEALELRLGAEKQDAVAQAGASPLAQVHQAVHASSAL
jgi:hypothetical protein